MGDSLSSEVAAPETEAECCAPVRLNVYHLGTTGGGKLVNSLLAPLGTGAFHCGVEILGYEWSFRSTPGWKGNGVFWCHPRQCKGHTHSESLHMGYCTKSEVEILMLLQKLMGAWPAADYHVSRRNCCHFCDEVCRRLGVGGIPSRVRNLADASAAVIGPVGGLFTCGGSELREASRDEES
mmetsp:Transcript_44974/g.90759  ORF Transcript_44974/g.90759 Transcript_44974/m.90759 type:complete len:181 (-) Transcript_44974:327-869(-)